MLTGKVFEYIASGRPVLCLGLKESDVAQLLKETKTGKLVEMEDLAGIKENILHFYTAFKEGNLRVKPEKTEQYSRIKLSEKLSVIFDKLAEKSSHE